MMKATKGLIREIQKNIPKGENVVKYLTWKLGISKESAYRRIRGTVPFPLEEIKILALDLNFSVDDIIRDKLPQPEEDQINQNDLLLDQILAYQSLTDTISRAGQQSVIFLANHIILPFIMEYDALFELHFFNQMHRIQAFNGIRSFSELSVYSEIQAIRKNILDKTPIFSHKEYIFGRDLFSGIARKIQYFRRLKLFSDEETEALKLEMLQMLGKMETEMETGRNEKGEDCFYYFSWLDVETDAICVDCGDKLVSLCRCFGVPVLQNNTQSQANLKWLESQKKYTILISQSSEFVRSEFIEQQKIFIESICDNRSFY